MRDMFRHDGYKMVTRWLQDGYRYGYIWMMNNCWGVQPPNDFMMIMMWFYKKLVYMKNQKINK